MNLGGYKFVIAGRKHTIHSEDFARDGLNSFQSVPLQSLVVASRGSLIEVPS